MHTFSTPEVTENVLFGQKICLRGHSSQNGGPQSGKNEKLMYSTVAKTVFFFFSMNANTFMFHFLVFDGNLSDFSCKILFCGIPQAR